MLVKNILKIASTYLQLNDCLDAQILGGSTVNPLTSTIEKLSLLTNCLNLCINEISNEHLFLLNEEQITVIDNNFSLTSLSKNAINVKKIETIYGTNIEFLILNSAIKVKSGTYNILYNYSPSDIELSETSTCEDFDGKISAKALAYGVCKEYCLITGLFEEAVMWNDQFQQSLLVAKRNKNSIILKQRRWLWWEQ